MEILDIVDIDGNPTGETVDRVTAHQEGILHRTAHIWLLRRYHGTIEILLQKRATTKQLFPGCYDVSSAGHIPTGVDYVASALRELKEELGINAKSEQLIECGIRHIDIQIEATDSMYKDKQVSKIFYMWFDGDITCLHLQQDEVEDVCWMPLRDCIIGVTYNTFKNCIAPEELDMIKNVIELES